MKTAIKQQPLGVLYYGNKPIGQPDTFRNLGSKARQLIAQGYNAKLIHKHYYNDNQNTSTSFRSTYSTSSNTQHTNTASERKEHLPQTQADEMNLKQYTLTDFWDATWLNKYMSEMGEDEFWRYQAKLYVQLSKLEVGQFMVIKEWCRPERYDLFMKIASCFVQESGCAYYFSNDFTKIIHKYDKKEYDTLVNRAKALRIQALSQETTATNS